MKYITSIIKLFSLALLSIVGYACTNNFDKINRKDYQVDKEELGRESYNVGASLKGLQGLVIPTEEHLYQFVEALGAGAFAGYIGCIVEWTAKFETYNPPIDWQEAPFSDLVTRTYPFYRDLLDKTDDPVALALGKLFRVVIMQRVTDMYGPIPYSKIISKTGKVSLTVPYDSQEEVYKQMFSELDEVSDVLRDNLNLSAEAFRIFDDVYQGNLSKWLKFTNSLKLRMAMRLTYVPEMQAEIQRIAEEAVTAGVMTEIIDNAFLKVEENRVAMIFNDWNDQRAGADIISYMNGYKDPRREKMFTTVKMTVYDENFQPQEVDGYAGIRIGIDVTTKDEMV
uniref:SusD/RagB family nutrient-binding outer membrane lipoprotein n=1 Tax=Bacteroides sp. TaxID=29523 RepID=UPI002A81052D